jgi:hypothetical protein
MTQGKGVFRLKFLEDHNLTYDTIYNSSINRRYQASVEYDNDIY